MSGFAALIHRLTPPRMKKSPTRPSIEEIFPKVDGISEVRRAESKSLSITIPQPPRHDLADILVNSRHYTDTGAANQFWDDLKQVIYSNILGQQECSPEPGRRSSISSQSSRKSVSKMDEKPPTTQGMQRMPRRSSQVSLNTFASGKSAVSQKGKAKHMEPLHLGPGVFKSNPMVLVKVAMESKEVLSPPPGTSIHPEKKIGRLTQNTLHFESRSAIQNDLFNPCFNDHSEKPFHANDQQALPTYVTDEERAAPEPKVSEPYVEYLTATSRQLSNGIRYVVDVKAQLVYVSDHYGDGHRQMLVTARSKNADKAASSGHKAPSIKSVSDDYKGYSPFVELPGSVSANANESTALWNTRNIVVDAIGQWAIAYGKLTVADMENPAYAKSRSYLTEDQYTACNEWSLFEEYAEDPEKLGVDLADEHASAREDFNMLSDATKQTIRDLINAYEAGSPSEAPSSALTKTPITPHSSTSARLFS